MLSVGRYWYSLSFIHWYKECVGSPEPTHLGNSLFSFRRVSGTPRVAATTCPAQQRGPGDTAASDRTGGAHRSNRLLPLALADLAEGWKRGTPTPAPAGKRHTRAALPRVRRSRTINAGGTAAQGWPA